MKNTLLLFVLLVSMTGLADGSHKHNGHNMPYEIVDARVRPTPPGITNTAAYFVFTNNSGNTVSLIGAKSSIAKIVELHEHTTSDGLMKMQKVEKINVAAGKTITFEPGGYHIMLIGIKSTIKEGHSIKLTLLLDNGKEVPVTAIARINTNKDHHHKH